MEGRLFHVSHTGDIKVLKPKISTHGKAYVYATKNLELALLFGSSKSYGDFDGMYGTINNKPYFYEAYQGALKRRFKGESCYIYEVDPTDFIEGETSFKSEVVSEKPVKVLSCTKIDDLYDYLLKLIDEGKIEFKQYSLDVDYQKEIKERIKNRIELFETWKDKESIGYKFCLQYHSGILKQVEEKSKTID